MPQLINEPPGRIGFDWVIGVKLYGGDCRPGNYEKGLVSLFGSFRVQPCANELWVLVGPSRLW
jgi:hypothetical protein